MRQKLTIFILFLTICCAGQTVEKHKRDSVVITFDKTEIIDTIYISSDTIEHDYNKNYTFVFQNTGTDNLIMTYTGGCDPCFMSDYPKQPVKPGQKSIIKITCPGYNAKSILDWNKQGQKQVTKQWEINSNAKNNVKLIVRQTFIAKK